jgi:hypothetical protein
MNKKMADEGVELPDLILLCSRYALVYPQMAPQSPNILPVRVSGRFKESYSSVRV